MTKRERSLTTKEKAILERIVQEFEHAWAQNQPPPLDKLLPVTAHRRLRRAVLVELVHIDYEFRLKAGDQVDPVEYVQQFPELAAEAKLLDDLVAAAQTQDQQQPETPPKSGTVELSATMPGSLLGSYTVLDLIGAGGMGMVFKAEHRRMKRVVALKMMRPSAMQSPAVVKRFFREIEAMSRLKHPNIVVAHDAFECNGENFLVMEYVEGIDLRRKVTQEGPLPVDKAVDYVVQAAEGLGSAHQHGIIHRDIKPANLLLDVHGTVKILDLGLARLLEAPSSSGAAAERSTLTDTRMTMGTIDFMSPEQAINPRQADRTSDIYSLGCTLYYLLTGNALYRGKSALERLLAHRSALIPSLRSSRRDISPRLDTIFQRMVAKQKDARYPTMEDVIGDLNQSR